MTKAILPYKGSPVDNFLRLWPNLSTGAHVLNVSLALAYIYLGRPSLLTGFLTPNVSSTLLCVCGGRLLNSVTQFSEHDGNTRRICNAISLIILFYPPTPMQGAFLISDAISELIVARKCWLQANPPINHSLITGLEDYDPTTIAGARFRLDYPQDKPLNYDDILAAHNKKIQQLNDSIKPITPKPIADSIRKIISEADTSRDTLLKPLKE